MEHLKILERPSLRNPIMLVAFGGWNDAAAVATSAVHFLIEHWSAIKFATIDPEEFFVFTETRPRVRLVGGAFRQIDWPANDFYYYVDPVGSRDYLLLIGVEPQLKWRTFTRAICDLAKQHGVTCLVSIGGLLADVAHTRPPRITGSSTDPKMLERMTGLTVVGSRYEGPTGILGVLSTLCRELEIPSASIWGNVPHYLTGINNPRVSKELLRAVGNILGLSLDLREFDANIAEFDSNVADALARNPEASSYVNQLEQRDREFRQVIEQESNDSGDSPPAAENLLKELEDFLRRRRREDEVEE